MMEFAVRSHMHPPTSAFQPLDALRTSASAGRFGQSRPYVPSSKSTAVDAPTASRYSTPPLVDGLRTPPPEMSTTYHGPVYSHSNGPLKQFEPPVANMEVSTMLDSFRCTTNSTQQQPPPKSQSPPQRHTPLSRGPQEEPRRRYSTSARNGASMTVPSDINPAGGNLGDFAAQMSCLFWFESTAVLHRVEESSDASQLLPTLSNDATASPGFRKWVTTILSTTQVSREVVLLALLFIYRLKKLNPTVQGKPGSEFRLFTVALMLGNKFLDDNTYTNKTWAEVSGINVQEIHIMEVEFLSNMRYSLYVSKRGWANWKLLLSKFWNFWDCASRPSLDQPHLPVQRQIPSLPPIPQPLPSPPSSSPPYNHSKLPSLPSTHPPQQQPHLPTPPALNPPHLPHTPMPQPDFGSMSRKRSFDYSSIANGMQPPNKRVTRSMAPKLTVTVPQFPIPTHSTTPTGTAPLPPLQPLQYSSAPPAQQHPRPTASVPSSQPPLQPQLPLPGTRSMSMVYPQPQTQPASNPITSNPTTHNIAISPYRHPSPSPFSAHHSAASSPTNPFGPQRSPTWILGNRQSPYRPVRTVNTLLVPPSNMSQRQQVPYEQMHYQPLAKARTQYRTGVVPYMQSDQSWSQPWDAANY